MIPAAIVKREIPFIGLHHFDEENADLFFGRDEQVRDLLAKLADSRFVTLIGSSGTGKSSLARAGLIPALRSGFLMAAGPRWRILTTHPGDAPIGNLSESMEGLFGAKGVELTLRRGPLGLVEAVRQCGLQPEENFLVIVDQFEEIFRYERDAKDRATATEESVAFVKLLLEASARIEPNIFILITMRSDYLGTCARFRDLPERINTGLYLIPRMKRDQMEEAITGPAAVVGARFSPALVQRLLNEAGDDPDLLPVLQHVLLRTWLNWRSDKTRPVEIGFDHYDSTGKISGGLSQHANEIYDSLTSRQQKIAEIVFRTLTERDPSNNDIRRPARLEEITAAAGAMRDEVRDVAEKFRGEGVSFLTPSAPLPIEKGTLLDITHESLIRKWSRLSGTPTEKGWVQEEAEVREQFRDLIKLARRAAAHQDVMSGSELDWAREWREKDLGAAWSSRYDSSPDAYQLIIEYIDRSEKARRHEMAEKVWQRLWSKVYGFVTVAFVLLLMVLVLSATSGSKDVQKDLADVPGNLAKVPKDLAKAARDAPEVVAQEAERAKEQPSTLIPPARSWFESARSEIELHGTKAASIVICIVGFALFSMFGEPLFRRIAMPGIIRRLAKYENTRRQSAPASPASRFQRTAYAGFGRRTGGFAIDAAIVFVLLFVWAGIDSGLSEIGWISSDTGWFAIAWFVSSWLLEALTLSSRWQATPGMKITHTVITDMRGRKISFARASARFFAKGFSFCTVIGMFLPLMTNRRQTFHDFITQTLAWETRRPVKIEVAPPPPPFVQQPITR